MKVSTRACRWSFRLISSLRNRSNQKRMNSSVTLGFASFSQASLFSSSSRRFSSSFCDPFGGASKAALCPNKHLKISALSGKMTVYKDSHRQEVAKAHGFWGRGAPFDMLSQLRLLKRNRGSQPEQRRRLLHMKGRIIVSTLLLV